MKQLERNSFRILGAASDSYYEEIESGNLSLEKAAKLGVAKKTAWDFPWLGVVSRTRDDIRDAASRLNNPLQRIKERVYWFSGDCKLQDQYFAYDIENGAAKICENSVWAAHDNALFSLVEAQRFDPEMKDATLWEKVLEGWLTCLNDNSYWELILKIDKEKHFEPSATKADIALIKKEAINEALNFPVEAIKSLVEKGEAENAKSIIKVIFYGSISASSIHDARNHILYWLEDKLHIWNTEIEKACYEDIRQDENSIAYNREICKTQYKKVTKIVEPAARLLADLAEAGTSAMEDSRTALASSYYAVAIGLTWADEFERSKDFFERAKAVVPAESPLVEHIDKNLENAKAMISRQGSLGYDQVDSAPSLYTINGIGTTIYSVSEKDQTGAYTAIYWFTVFFLPVIPIRQYRVRYVGKKTYQFLGKKPISKNLKIWRNVVYAALLVMAFSMFLPETTSTSKSALVNPATTQPLPAGSTATQSSGAASQQTTYSGTSQNNKKWQLNSLNTQINSLKAALTDQEAKLTGINSELDSIQTRMNAAANDANTYNSLVEKYNAKLKEYNTLYGQYKLKITEHNSLVNQYNSLLKE